MSPLLLLGLPVVLASSQNASVICKDGLILPAWLPLEGFSDWVRVIRGAVYFLSMIYIFIGISVISDRFMSAIEVITTSERNVTVRETGGVYKKRRVRVWNETVANLTLMALGSSAPEIMLSIIEVYYKNFESGDLGPGTIVGSAAYNLFGITALCISVVPKGETRRIKDVSVFFVTAAWSIFAYLWLYTILAVTSVGIVEVWEGVLTFMFFPFTVITAYIASRCSAQDDGSINPKDLEILGNTLEQAKIDYTNLLRELKKEFPKKSLRQIGCIAEEKIESSGPKSRAYYRIMAIKDFTGEILSRRRRLSLFTDESKGRSPIVCQTSFRFENPVYTVLENIGLVEVTVIREGSDIDQYVVINYHTEDGTAKWGTDYVGTCGIIVFRPGDSKKVINIEIVDDLIFEKDEFFFVHLTNLRFSGLPNPRIKLVKPVIAKIVILDDDHAGHFSFEMEDLNVSESDGVVNVPIVRNVGARGTVRVPYWTKDGTAEAGIDYIESHSYTTFENNEIRRTIPIGIVPEHCYERNVSLFVELGEPEEDNLVPNNINHKREEDMTTEEKVALEGRPRLGPIARVQINIRESDEFKNTVDKLVQKRGASAVSVSTSSWGEQFVEAIRVNPDGEAEEDGLPETTGWGGYVLHFLTLFWKILFAFVPPAEYCCGWLCFWSAISFIGMLTAVIGDVSSHLGCTVGLKDAVTAICFVAMGTSLPDTFASKVSAIQDSTADNSVGNVTGSNAVNVFLGIGVAWSIAAIYHACHGSKFIVPPGNLGFSVMLFCTEALFAIAVLLIRRCKFVGGELGGPVVIKYVTSAFMFGLWILYLTLSTLEAYDVIHV